MDSYLRKPTELEPAARSTNEPTHSLFPSVVLPSHELGTPDGTGRYNHFRSGPAAWQVGSIYRTPNAAFEMHGAIRTRCANLGWERSYLGYPTSDEFAVPGGRRSNSQHGFIVYEFATDRVIDRPY